jgi:CubicO group peptidase (beta-lactamase class C family)
MNADLDKRIAEGAERLNVPGVAVCVYHQGSETYSFHGVTNIENPLPVDESTLFQFGSTGKTYTATAIMRLVEDGKVKLNERVRTYLPDFKLKDEVVARDVTVRNLVNHTAGWQGDFSENTGEGDDALEKYVAKLDQIDQEFPLGKAASYNNSAFSLAGRIIEVVTGKTYEQAIKEMLLDPLGLENTFFFLNDIMTRKFVVGHDNHPDGSLTISRPWGLSRGGNPAGGMSSNARDQIAWAKFHLGDGKSAEGSTLLSRTSLDLMKEPTTPADGAALGDYVGLSWMIRDINGVRELHHGGSTNGQQSAFHMIPEKDFAIAVLTSASPNGIQFHQELVKWAFDSYVGVIDEDPVPETRTDAELGEYLGRYASIAIKGTVTADAGKLALEAESRNRDEDGGYIDELPPFSLAMIPGGDKFIVTEGPFQKMQGVFTRDSSGEIDGVHFGGRLMLKQP